MITSDLVGALKTRRVIVSCGTGGVGKTTLSAAMAVRAAIEGRRVIVVTLDPAKRLATSLGLEDLGHEPKDLSPLLGAKIPAGAQLWAMMPDTRRTFEDVVRSLSPNEAFSARILKNPIFQIFAKEFSGTNEYMALERLRALRDDSRFDLIILDTPPSRNTLDFLDAPTLLARFFEDRLVQLVAKPANRFFAFGMNKAMGLLERLTGAGFMASLVDFASALLEVQDRFVRNLKAVSELLASPDLGFVLVTVPSPDTLEDIRHFVDQVRERKFTFEGVALNRCLSDLPGTSPDLLAALQDREKRAIAMLNTEFDPPIPVCTRLPELARDIHCLEDLTHVAMALDH